MFGFDNTPNRWITKKILVKKLPHWEEVFEEKPLGFSGRRGIAESNLNSVLFCSSLLDGDTSQIGLILLN